MEPSTRTEISFKVACNKLGINVVDLNMNSSSITKGETFEDTLQTLEAMGIEGAIIRTKDETLIEGHRDSRKLSLINAGSGQISHPSQAMLDLLTIYNSFNRIDNLKVTIVGDIKHSRVAASHIKLHKELGNQI
jgi:aspartate carbamoyltransferase catalytic subunit